MDEEAVVGFLRELTELTCRCNLVIGGCGCGCCGSPYPSPIDDEDGQYSVDSYNSRFNMLSWFDVEDTEELERLTF